MARFLAVWAACALGMIAIVELVPGIDATSTSQMVVGSMLLGLLNAAVRPGMLIARWPMGPLATAVAALAVNGIVIAGSEPITMAWRFSNCFLAGATMATLAALTTVLSLVGTGPMEDSIATSKPEPSHG